MNESKTLVAFVTKEEDCEENENDQLFYCPYVVEINTNGSIVKPYDFGKKQTAQTMVQFLYKKNNHSNKDRLLILIHQQGMHTNIFILYTFL